VVVEEGHPKPSPGLALIWADTLKLQVSIGVADPDVDQACPLGGIRLMLDRTA